VNSTTKQVPREVTVVDRSTQTVAAPSPQRIGGTTYVFTGWSDGGEQTHTLRVERPGLELRATYSPQSASAGLVPIRS
jgi:hypothetical protein